MVAKAIIVHKHAVKHRKPPRPEVIIVDPQQFLCHVVWPCGGSVDVLAEALKARHALCAVREKILVLPLMAKDHER